MRYRRQLIMNEIGETGQKKIEQTTVAIVGCGGLGSLNIYYLAALGIKRLILIDDDKVEESNLNRQIIHDFDSLQQYKAHSAREKVKRLNSNVQVTTCCERLNQDNINDILADADIIVDAVDNLETRYFLDEYCSTYNKPVIFAAVEGFNGSIYARLTNKMKPYSEIFRKSKIKKREIGVAGAAVGVISSLQCTEVLKYIIANEPSYNSLLSINLLEGSMKKLKV